MIDAASVTRHVSGDGWFVDETYFKVAGKWTYLYRAVDQFGQVIDVMASQRRDLAAARRFFTRALRQGRPAQVMTDRAAAYPRVLDELLPEVHHVDARYASGHAFVQNIRRRHYELATETEGHLQLTAAFTELMQAV